jgi:RNA-binding protein
MKGSREAALRRCSCFVVRGSRRTKNEEQTVLTAKQRQFLKGLAHSLSPVVRVGKGGLTPAVIHETKKSLLAHELIKVRIDVEDGAARRAVAEELARAADADVAGTIGKLAIVYRARDEKPKIKLPK